MSKLTDYVKSLIPAEGDSSKEKTRKVIFLTAVTVFIIAAVMLIIFFIDQGKNKRIRDELADIYNETSASLPAATTTAPAESDDRNETSIFTSTVEMGVDEDGNTYILPTENKDTMTAPEVNLSGVDRLLAINPDTVGWVKIDGTEINNVVVRAKDNKYYLDKSFYGVKAKAGTIFADYRCKLDTGDVSDNVVLYGHNQHDGTMFGDLHNYNGNVWYYREHPTVSFNTNHEAGTYKIFAYFVTNASPEGSEDGTVFNYHDYHDFPTEELFDYYMSQIMKRSEIITNVDVKYGDKLLTLSTCSTEFADSRLVVVARKLREGESADVNMSGVRLCENGETQSWLSSSASTTEEQTTTTAATTKASDKKKRPTKIKAETVKVKAATSATASDTTAEQTATEEASDSTDTSVTGGESNTSAE